MLVCDDSLRDLQSFTRRAHHRAARGGRGEGSLRHGADGEALVVRVPPGTEAIGEEGDLEGRRWELLYHGQRAPLARGGSGGKGNKRFATPTRQAPRFAERGLPGEEGWLTLRLRLLADVGLVGLPNAGKSSLLARLTRAAPKVASYPFTTLEPVLGVLESDERQLVVADIPGLIEGASDGVGLGHEFLAHVERTCLLVHVLDLAPENWDPTHPHDADAAAAANYATVEQELAAHDPRLAALPRVLALSKADLVPPERARAAVAEWSERLGERSERFDGEIPVIATSSATGAGLAELGATLLRLVPVGERAAAGRVAEETASSGSLAEPEQLAEHMVFRPAERTGFKVERVAEGAFVVRGPSVERLLQRFDVENDDAMAYVEGRLRRLGVLRALQDEGFQPGDELRVAGVVLELDAAG